jgi:hypothetical protein
VANDDIILLGLLDLAEEVTARRVLEAEGAGRDRVLTAIRTRGDAPSDSPQGLSYPPRTTRHSAERRRSRRPSVTASSRPNTPFWL